MIRLVVALPAEARPLIRRFGLERGAAGEFPVWQARGVSLVTSGVGRAAAASATAFLAGRGRSPEAGWLNVGIGGHRSLPLAEIVLARQVVDAANGSVSHRRLAFAPPCATATVTTVDRPELEYPEDTVYEMEAAGFCEAAARFAAVERIQVIKVISDNAGAPPERLTAGRVEELVEGRIETIAAIAELSTGPAGDGEPHR